MAETNILEAKLDLNRSGAGLFGLKNIMGTTSTSQNRTRDLDLRCGALADWTAGSLSTTLEFQIKIKTIVT